MTSGKLYDLEVDSVARTIHEAICKRAWRMAARRRQELPSCRLVPWGQLEPEQKRRFRAIATAIIGEAVALAGC